MTSFDEKILKVVKTIDDNALSVDMFKDKWVSILGDSISTFPEYIPDEMIAAEHEGLDTVDKEWWHIVLTKLGAKLCVNCSCSGMQASGDDELKGAAINEYGEALHRIVGQSYKNLDGTTTIAEEEQKPDIILIYLGTNDLVKNAALGENDLTRILSFSDPIKYDTFINAYEAILFKMILTYPYATIYCITPHQSKAGTVTKYPFNNTASPAWNALSMNEAIRTLALKFQCKMISLNDMNVTCASNHIGSNRFLLSDGIHPTVYGHKLIAKKVIHDMKSDPISWNTRNDL